MEITKEMYEKIAHLFLKQKSPPKISNLEALNAILKVLENGSKWRSLGKKRYLLMDKAYEDNNTRFLTQSLNFKPIVPPKSNRKTPWIFDKVLYKPRNNIERLFRKIKRFRRIFTRYDKLDSIFLFFIYLAFIFDSLFRVNRP